MLNELGKRAKIASMQLNLLETKQKNEALKSMANAIIQNCELILQENLKDINIAKQSGLSEVLIERLTLNKKRVFDMSQGILNISLLKDPIGEVDKMWRSEDNLLIGKQKVPIGVIGIIYESRPNVTTDASALCFKTSNSLILRGGKETINTNKILVSILREALKQNDINEDAILLIEDTSRQVALELMKLNKYLDVLIPRGSANLIKTVVQNATVPVIETGSGNCHIYVDKDADLQMATNIIINAKTQRPTVCNAAETLIIHKDIAKEFLPKIETELKKFSVELRADERAFKILQDVIRADEKDWKSEFLDFILAIKVVNSIDEAIFHINNYNTKHSESIITNDYFAAQKFLKQIDAACVYVNASTRFSDGEMFGFGAEIGISTQKLHARGPMGLEALTSTKYIIYGQGECRK